MNFLAHAHLSFNNPEVLVGNMISDFVKGKKKFDYPPAIQKGIHLHRQIDAFTDDHEATREAIRYLKPAVGMYAGAFVDVVFDHFLANDPKEFTEASLSAHAQVTYHHLQSHEHWLPEKFLGMLPFMKAQNWLFNYKTLEGTRSSFGGVVRRARYLEESDQVYQLFIDNYDDLRQCYDSFFPEVKAFSKNQLEFFE